MFLDSLVRINEPKRLFLDSLIRNNFSKILFLDSFFETETLKLNHLFRTKCFFANLWPYDRTSAHQFDIKNLNRFIIIFQPKTKNQVPEEKCTTPKPFEVRPCHKPACPPVWIIGSWRECEPHMGKCGDGYNYREVQCKRGNNVIPDISCREK